jgi:alkylation response protein AidB-like acyl-CoA dehydrogenase
VNRVDVCVLGPRLARTARAGGAAGALRALYARTAPRTPVVGPGGHAVVPEEMHTGGTDVALPWLAGSGLRAVRGLGTSTVDEHAGWLADLAWLRLGVCEGLLDATVAYLRDRGLLRHQLVRGSLADALAALLAVRAALDEAEPVDAAGAPAARAAVVDLHGQLTTAGRVTLRLHGATGYTTAGPGRDTHASELIADGYLSRPVRGCGHG